VCDRERAAIERRVELSDEGFTNIAHYINRSLNSRAQTRSIDERAPVRVSVRPSFTRSRCRCAVSVASRSSRCLCTHASPHTHTPHTNTQRLRIYGIDINIMQIPFSRHPPLTARALFAALHALTRSSSTQTRPSFVSLFASSVANSIAVAVAVVVAVVVALVFIIDAVVDDAAAVDIDDAVSGSVHSMLRSRTGASRSVRVHSALLAHL
jgi:hypothetical protein